MFQSSEDVLSCLAGQSAANTEKRKRGRDPVVQCDYEADALTQNSWTGRIF